MTRSWILYLPVQRLLRRTCRGSSSRPPGHPRGGETDGATEVSYVDYFDADSGSSSYPTTEPDPELPVRDEAPVYLELFDGETDPPTAPPS